VVGFACGFLIASFILAIVSCPSLDRSQDASDSNADAVDSSCLFVKIIFRFNSFQVLGVGLVMILSTALYYLFRLGLVLSESVATASEAQYLRDIAHVRPILEMSCCVCP
jgi:hypothetical protein